MNTKTSARFVKTLYSFRTITLCYKFPVCRSLYNFICMEICLRDLLNFIIFLFWLNFGFTEKLPR